MNRDTLETELIDGSRNWDEAQLAFTGTLDQTRPRHSVDVSWYDTDVDDNEGAFCMIQSGSALEELVGEFVRVYWRGKVAYLYCVGGAGLGPEPLALQRRAFLHFAPLSSPALHMAAQAVLK